MFAGCRQGNPNMKKTENLNQRSWGLAFGQNIFSNSLKKKIVWYFYYQYDRVKNNEMYVHLDWKFFIDNVHRINVRSICEKK